MQRIQRLARGWQNARSQPAGRAACGHACDNRAVGQERKGTGRGIKGSWGGEAGGVWLWGRDEVTVGWQEGGLVSVWGQEMLVTDRSCYIKPYQARALQRTFFGLLAMLKHGKTDLLLLDPQRTFFDVWQTEKLKKKTKIKKPKRNQKNPEQKSFWVGWNGLHGGWTF